jgi:hypothetical protein
MELHGVQASVVAVQRPATPACVPRSTMRPWSMTRIRSAFSMVDRRCAMTSVVRFGHDVVECVLDVPFRFGVERRSRLVENQDRRILEHGAGDGQALALSARQHHAVFTDQRVVACPAGFSMNSLGKSRLGGPFDRPRAAQSARSP